MTNSPTNLEHAESAEMEPNDPAMAELLYRLDKLPKTDRGISWERRNWQDREQLNVYGETASLCKWVLDNAEALASRIRSCLLDKPEAVEGEPFAWYTVDKHGCDYMSRNEHNLRNIAADVHGEVTPLYKQPPAGAEVIERLCKALEAAETYVIDGVTTAKQNLEMNAAYPARKPRYEAELQEARDIYAECQAARRAAVAAAKDKP
ncbi:hypothetical protein RWA05_17885 [Sinorhizobium meliloti]|uniref:hypothetical protein n=1 Tax=Rhizobium meliloti TaxID=382 RepID=UPI00299E6E2D